MSHAVDALWTVALKTPHVDADTLACAIEAAVQDDAEFDYRTRLLVRDSVAALNSHWGDEKYQAWLNRSPQRQRIEQICAIARAQAEADNDDRGFSTLTRKIVDVTKPEDIVEFFRVLARRVRRPAKLVIGGSVALMLSGLLSRRTDDVDVVNEVPADIRNEHELLEALTQQFNLKLAHFQSHYLPRGWEQRLRPFQSFDDIEVSLVDPYDVLISKLCSKRLKDLADLRALKPQIDRSVLASRLTNDGQTLMSEQRLREAAKDNWYILFGEDLPA